MKKIEQAFNKILFTEMIYSVVYAIIGFIIFLKSEMTNTVVGMLIGTFLIINGILSLFSFINRNKFKLFRCNILFGIIKIILGIFILFSPLSILNFLNILLGVVLLVESSNKIVYFLYLRKVKENSSKMILASAVLFMLLGIMILLNPFRTLIITKIVGIFIMLYNILNINDLVLLKKRSQKFLQLFK